MYQHSQHPIYLDLVQNNIHKSCTDCIIQWHYSDNLQKMFTMFLLCADWNWYNSCISFIFSDKYVWISSDSSFCFFSPNTFKDVIWPSAESSYYILHTVKRDLTMPSGKIKQYPNTVGVQSPKTSNKYSNNRLFFITGLTALWCIMFEGLQKQNLGKGATYNSPSPGCCTKH